MDKQKRYNIAATVRKAIHAQAMLGHQEVVCSAILSRRGKSSTASTAPRRRISPA